MTPSLIELTVNSRVLLTGASGGLGGAIARGLAERDVKLILSGRNEEALRSLASELGAEVIVADLAERAEVDRLAERAGEVDVLVANAALPASGQLDDFFDDQIDRALDVNLRAPVLLAKLLMKGMVARGSGHLVFISSLSGKVATPNSALYSATKFGLRGFASALRQDLHGTGIGVSTVFPGAIRDAGMWAETGVEMPRVIGTGTPKQVVAAVVRGIERNKAEIDVAPALPRLSSKFAQVAPSLNAAFIRRLGVREISAEVAAAQRGLR